MLCSFAQIRSLHGAILGPALVIGLLFTAGCWNEVSYDTPSPKGPSNEALSETEGPAPGEETVEEPADELTDEPAIEAPSLSDPDETEEIVTPVETGRYTTSEAPAEEPSEELLPWETASSADDTSPEAERLFGGSDESLDEAEAPEVVEEVEAKEEDPDDFESFLTEAYADLVDEPTDTPEPEVEEPEAEKPAGKPVEEPPREIVAEEEIADLPLPETVALPPTELAKEELPDTELPPQKYSEEDFEEESFESLFADPEEPEPTEPAVDPAPSRYAEEPLPLPPKEPVMPEPPESTTALGPRIEPLPAVSVLPNNTRHLAWLLGGKLSLAQLAGASGATSDEVALWTEETQRLAEQLKVTTPPSADAQASGIERVGRLLGSAAEISNTLAVMYGPDHAALVEMALKTNALLVLHQERPDLTPAVARAVAAAANRADLPGYVWRDTIKVLERRPTVDEVYDAVIQLHADVEAHLR